jgi:hypothetical protein
VPGAHGRQLADRPPLVGRGIVERRPRRDIGGLPGPIDPARDEQPPVRQQHRPGGIPAGRGGQLPAGRAQRRGAQQAGEQCP